ncbi:ABC transporter substrate-binding protein [Enterococcus faecium]|nr:ABC transporter substrate-binding protein [Enterococcus faecium]
MKQWKKLSVALLGVSLIGVLTACGTGSERSSEDNLELTVWTFTDELSTMINEYYLPAHESLDYEIKIVEIPSDQFETKLDPVLGTRNAPDVIALESAFVKKYVESGLMADLGEYGLEEAASDTYLYVKDVGTSREGTLHALAWQAAPGGFYYRASLAESLLGITDADEMQEQIADYEKFYEVAKEVKENSGGTVQMISSVQDLAKPFFGMRESGWVEDEKLIIDDKLHELMDISRRFVEEDLTKDTEGQSEAWFAGMNGETDFGYSPPTWGLHYWLKQNATSADGSRTTEGDWRMIQGPSSWFWGGTWIGATDTSEMKEEAAALIQYLTTDPEFLEQWAKDTGDFVSNERVVEAIKSSYQEDFLGGQNHYNEFSEMVQSINAKILTEYDQTIETLFIDHCLTPYSKGETDKESAIQNFKDAVANAYPDLEID